MAVNNANVISLFLDGTKVAVATSHTLFTSLERSGGQNEPETFSGELQITGSVSQVDIT